MEFKKLSRLRVHIVEEKLKKRRWKKYDYNVCSETSKFCEPKEGKTYAPNCSPSSWDNFIQGDPIKAEGFDLFCLALKIDPAEVAYVPKIDWGQAPDLETFHGREPELADLKKWIVDERCRLISIVGFAGIGKTKLSLELARQVEEEFEYIIWRRLYDRLPLENLLKKLIKFVSDNRETELAGTTGGLTEQLLRYLKERRCLLIFDNIESIRHDDREDGYGEEYKDFFQCIGTSKHSSCLLLTSRVKFSNLERIEGIYSDAVRSLELEGLDTEAGRKIFQDIVPKSNREIQGAEEDWQHLISSYKGNPLALQIVAIHIHKVYRGDLAQFLKHDLRVLQDIEQLFNWHFEHLTSDEQTIMYWLALNREGIAMDKLREYLIFDREKRYLPQTLENLDRKIPIERSGDCFTLHSLLMEYLTEQIIEKVCAEITSGRLELFNTHALIQASAKDYIKQKQIDSILQPIIDRLKESFGLEPQNSLKNRLPQLLENWDRTISGYTGGNLINLMRYAGIPIEGYDFSVMTIWEANLDTNLQNVNFTDCKFARCNFAQNFNRVRAIAFHPKQDSIAVADRINGIGLYNLENWQCYLNLDQSEETKELAFSSNGNFIVSISGGRTVKVWNTNTGECRYTFSNRQQIETIAFAPDNQTVAIASKPATVFIYETIPVRNENYTVSLWNIRTDECRIVKTKISEFEHDIKIIFCSQKNLLLCMQNSKFSVWNTDTKELLCSHYLKAENSINLLEIAEAFNFHPSKEILVTVCLFGNIKLWDVKTGKHLKTFKNNIEGLSIAYPVVYPIRFVSFNSDGHTILTVYKNGTIKLWDVKMGKCLRTWSGNEDFIYTTTFSPQNNILAISYGSKVLKLLNVKTGKWLKTWQFHSNNINEISISSDGQYLATHSKDNTIRLLNIKLERLSAWRLNHVIHWGAFGQNYRVYFSPDCQTLAIFSKDTVVKLFDVKTGQEQKTFKHLPSTCLYPRIPKMKFSPDSNLLGRYSVSSSEIILWDLKSKEMLRSIKTKPSSEILFGQNNRFLANFYGYTIIKDRNYRREAITVQIWNIETGECCYNFDFHNVFNASNFDIMAFHPNNRVLICHDRSKNEILLLNFQTGEFRSTLKVDEAQVRGVFFDSEANICIVTTINTTIEIRKVGTDRSIQVLEGHASDIKGVDFTPDGRILVSYDIDNNIYVWNLKAGNLDRKGCLEMPYNGMNIAGVTGLTPAQKAALIAQGAVETWISND